MAMLERYFYYEPADFMACESHMADAFTRWFPETVDEVGFSLWGTRELDELVSALKASGELLETQFEELGIISGPAEDHCMALHWP
ncbi:hypothetical protein ACIOEX_10530 [Streptomyces sp. NPDC087850]|uniref:hypothetical protein n=1 Tax=Streptomyces sp. NPDC087850 TaxID=3365809 RepID=UPI00382120DD